MSATYPARWRDGSVVGVAFCGLVSVVVAGFWILSLPADAQAVAVPAVALIAIPPVFIVTLWKRDGVLPVGELGAVCGVATATYSLFPLVGFLLAGMKWGDLSDNRLFVYNPGPEELSGLVWRHVAYLLSFVVTYLYVRGDAPSPRPCLSAPDLAMTVTIVFLLAVFAAYFMFLKLYFGVTYSGSYADLQAGIGAPTQLPYFLQQISHNLAGVMLVLKQGLLYLCLLRWRNRSWRYILYIWLSTEIVMSVLIMGARTEILLLLISATILYHHLVRPLTLWKVIVIGPALLIGLLVFGAVRDYGDVPLNDSGNLWAATNEFQALFGTAFDLYARKSTGTLGEVPLQLYLSDLYMVVPSQLLPFEKWEPAEWYLDLIGLRGMGQGLMFGVVSQAIIGLDWVELVLRGGLLGLIFAKIHRWYARRRGSEFWAIMLYLFLSVWSYYTFRGTTFSLVYMVVYRFFPAMLIIYLGRALLRASHPLIKDRADPPLHP